MSNLGSSDLSFADIAVTYTASQFHGIYRGKKQHEEDFDAVLSRATSVGCKKIILTTMTLEGARQNLDICKFYPGQCYMTLGIHPYHASELYAEPEAWATLVSLANTLPTRDGSCVVAFGEIGLDYFYLNKASKEDQQRAFKEQLELATTLDLPLFLHIRDSHQDFVEIIKPYLPRLPRRGVVHSFTGNADQMQELVDLGFDISVCGISFTTAEQLEMVKEIPLDRLHLESDAPWCEIPSTPQINGLLQSAPSLPPSQKPKNYVSGHMVQGRNESCTINRVALVVAGIKDLALDTVANAAWQNSLRMFKLHDTVDN